MSLHRLPATLAVTALLAAFAGCTSKPDGGGDTVTDGGTVDAGARPVDNTVDDGRFAMCQCTCETSCVVECGDSCASGNIDEQCFSCMNSMGCIPAELDPSLSECPFLCTSSDDCTDPDVGLHCRNDHLCGCITAADCGSDWNACVNNNCAWQCQQDTDCGRGESCENGTCILRCQSDADCKAADPTRPTCSSGNSCVVCETDAHCAGSEAGTRCITGACTCKADGDCPNPAHVCRFDACLQRCNSNQDCPSGTDCLGDACW